MILLFRRLQTASALVLVMAFILAGCAGNVAAPANLAAANLAVKAPAAAPAGAAELLDYLKDAQGDLAVVDKLLADKDLGLTEDVDTSSEDTLTQEEIAQYSALLADYDTQVKSALAAVDGRATPADDQVAYFRAAETSELQLAQDMTEEYIQVLNYYNMMTDVENIMGGLGQVDINDLEGTYKAYNEAIGKAIDEINGSAIPSSLKSLNDNFVAALVEFNNAVLYMLQALSINDPLRLDAAMYRLGILQRNLDQIGNGLDDDLANRFKKLVADAKGMQQTNEGLKKWVQDNIDKLQAQ